MTITSMTLEEEIQARMKALGASAADIRLVVHVTTHADGELRRKVYEEEIAICTDHPSLAFDFHLCKTGNNDG